MKRLTRAINPDVVVHKERARQVLTPLYENFMGRKKLFSLVTPETDAPQRLFIPDGVGKGSVKHRRFLCFAAGTDRRENSYKVYESHKRLWEKFPSLYSKKAIHMLAEEIESLLLSEKVGSPRQSAQYWPRVARTVFEEFDGDPLNIFKKFPSIDKILRFKDNGEGNILPGFGPKILSLLALFYSELDLIPTPPDAFPVDVHIQRLCISTGILTGEGWVLNDKVERKLRPLLCELCLEEGWEQLWLSHAGWFLGNRCCNGCYRFPAMGTVCPVYDFCGGPIQTKTYTRRGFWDLDAPRLRKGGEMTLSPIVGPLFPYE